MRINVIDLIDKLDHTLIVDHRKDLLKPLRDYIVLKSKQKVEANLNFICTHNSRRSQFTQVWAKIISDYYGFNINSFSGGTEVTNCNTRTISSFERMGFKVKNPAGENPHYELTYHEKRKPIIVYSKTFDDISNPKNNFAAVMTCTNAEENCPIIPGAEKRISLPFEDPKIFDNSAQESEKYDERSIQIATEMKYVFKVRFR
ncbi:MAG: protein-tyrosine-phosphatase [Flavobacteriaceae bacterium]